MITESLGSGLVPSGLKSVAQPSGSDVSKFQDMLGDGGPVNENLKTFVENSEQKLQKSQEVMNSKLNDFSLQYKVNSLVQSMHESSMRSVSIQLTGKVGSKVSEGFEQLIKQQ